MSSRISSAAWLVTTLLTGAATATAQQPNQQRESKDTVQRIGAVTIVATPSGRGETRGANAVGKLEL